LTDRSGEEAASEARKRARRSQGQQQPEEEEAEYDGDMPVDPNEPTYCTCRQVAFGEMVGCENVSVRDFDLALPSDIQCPVEWFHFECMGITEKPKGKWYCPLCRPTFT